MMNSLQGLQSRFDRWLFAGCHPVICSLMRLAFATVLIVYVAMWWRESERWFSDTGVLRAETMQQVTSGGNPSLLFWLPGDPTTIKLCLAVFMGQAVLLWLGVWSRFQVACIFVWLVSFQHRNTVICDGQDVLIRLLAFYMIFMPLDYAFSLRHWWLGAKRQPQDLQLPATSAPSAWGLRLVQLQISAIYLSTAWEKSQGLTWRNGTALFYVSRMDDLFGRFGLPDFLFETPWMLAAMTWGVMGLEAVLPLLLWFPRTRLLGVLVAAGLHLSIEATMHIYLFEWLMLVSLLSFVEPKWFGKVLDRSVT